jgi:hypothetical protein
VTFVLETSRHVNLHQPYINFLIKQVQKRQAALTLAFEVWNTSLWLFEISVSQYWLGRGISRPRYVNLHQSLCAPPCLCTSLRSTCIRSLATLHFHWLLKCVLAIDHVEEYLAHRYVNLHQPYINRYVRTSIQEAPQTEVTIIHIPTLRNFVSSHRLSGSSNGMLIFINPYINFRYVSKGKL